MGEITMIDESILSERLRGLASDMRSIGASTMTPHELLSYFATEVDRAADMAERAEEGSEAMLVARIAELQSRLNNVALGSGKLTAEQVRECVERVYLEGYSDGSMNRGAHIEETDWQAIADELNERAERTCKITASSTDGLTSDNSRI